MVGRPRKPTKLKIVQGNPGKRKLPENEPQPTLGIPTRPGWLSPEAKREWNRVVAELDAIGLLATVDRALLTAYCECWGQYVDAVKALRKAGSMTFETDKGYIAQRPEIGIAKAMVEKMMQLSTRFGFTPSDRAKMVAPQVHEEDPFAEFLNRGKKTGTGDDE